MKRFLIAALMMLWGEVALAQDVQGALARLQQIQQDIAATQALLQSTPTVQVPLADAQRIIDGAATGVTLQLQAGVNYPPLTLSGPGKVLLGGSVQHLDVTSAVGWTIKDTTILGDPARVEGIWCDPSSNHITFDGIVFHGSGTIRRAIAANCPSVVVRRAHIDGVAAPGVETQGISAWQNVGPITIIDNYISAGSENVFIGGGAVNPDGVYVARNILEKPDSWRTQHLVVKNLFEVKSGLNVVFEDNTLIGSWLDGQLGFAIVLTIRNQDGSCPQCTIKHLIVRRNVASKVGGGINILGVDDTFPSVKGDDWVIDSNTINLAPQGSDGARAIQLAFPPTNLSITNTKFTLVGAMNSFLYIYGSSLSGFTFTGNEVYQGDYGIFGQGASTLGKAALDFYAPDGYVWSGNQVHTGSGFHAGEGRSLIYPSGTTIVP